MSVADEIKILNVTQSISSRDEMFDPTNRHHYFFAGRSALLTVLNTVSIRLSYPGGDIPIQEMLDFGCGYGRVTRWFRAAFPKAQIYVTDYDKAGVEWCVKEFSVLDLGPDIPSDRFDLIWLGSVFTHLSAAIAEPLLKSLLAALRPNGILVLTSQGRFAAQRMADFDWQNDKRNWMHYYLDRERFQLVLGEYDRTGYGYVDYPNQTNYGLCIAKPTWYSERALETSEFIQILLQEKGNDNHQDVSAFLRADLLDPAKGPLW
jgi:SAM-dependent methyltransferase